MPFSFNMRQRILFAFVMPYIPRDLIQPAVCIADFPQEDTC